MKFTLPYGNTELTHMATCFCVIKALFSLVAIFFTEQGAARISRPLCLPSEQLLPCTLPHIHIDVRQGIGAHMIRVVNYAHFFLSKFGF